MKAFLIFLVSMPLMANYSVDEAQSLVQELDELQAEIKETKTRTKKKKRILSLADILNKDKAQTERMEKSNSKVVMDLDSVFKSIETDTSSKKAPVRSR